jgi:hypothetical protein
MGGIFISYRKGDALSAAGRLFDGLEPEYGKDGLFRDVVKIQGGVDYVEAIETALESCSVVLAVIGRQWLEIGDAQGRRRLDDSSDILRRELEIALERRMHLIPVLVDGAKMPAEEDLPDGLKPLTRLQAHDLTDRYWKSDLKKLVELLAGLGEPPTKGLIRAAFRRRLQLAAVAAFAVGLLCTAKPLAQWTGLDASIPGSVLEHTPDGGFVLAALIPLAIFEALSDRRAAALPGVVDDLIKTVRFLAVVIALLLSVTVLIERDMLVTGVVLATLGGAYLIAKRFASVFFLSAARTTATAALAFFALAIAWWVDVAIKTSRENSQDVAFLLPPDGGYSPQAERIFEGVKEAFVLSIMNIGSLQMVPDHLTPTDFSRYDFSKQDALLAYKPSQGYPRIFIRIKHNLNDRSNSLRILLTLYQRTEDHKGLQPLGRWTHPPWEASSSPNDLSNEISRVGYQATFDVISFLSSMKLIKLDPVQQRRFWHNLLEEYQRVLAVTDCENKELIQMISAVDTLDESKIRQVLSVSCGAAKNGPSTSEPNKAIDTVTALYTSTFAQ